MNQNDDMPVLDKFKAKAQNADAFAKLLYTNISPQQLRAARGLLDWTRADCAKISCLSPETIKNIEHGVFKPNENTREAIIKAFAEHGVQFFTINYELKTSVAENVEVAVPTAVNAVALISSSIKIPDEKPADDKSADENEGASDD